LNQSGKRNAEINREILEILENKNLELEPEDWKAESGKPRAAINRAQFKRFAVVGRYQNLCASVPICG